MAASKDNKVFDVAKPGKTAAPASSRPLIIGHKAILKDPMVKDEAVDEEQLSGNPAIEGEPAPEPLEPLAKSPSASHLKIKPLAKLKKAVKGGAKAEEAVKPVKTSKVKIISDEPEEESSDDPVIVPVPSGKTNSAAVAASTESEPDAAEEPVEEEAESTANESNETEATEEAPADSAEENENTETSNETTADENSASSEAEAVGPTEEAMATEATDSTAKSSADSSNSKSKSSSVSSDSSVGNDKSDSIAEAAQKKSDKEAQAQAARNEELEKEITTGEFLVPIGEKTRKKRSLRNILTGLLLIILLGGALVYLMIDVGIIKANINLPYHFFKQDTLSTPAPLPSPKTVSVKKTTPKAAETSNVPDDYVVYQNKTLGFKFAYPKTWGTAKLQSDPAKIDLFLLNFDQSAINKDSRLSIELRAQKLAKLKNTDSVYAQGYIKSGTKYYVRAGDNTLDPTYLIKSSDFISVVNSSLGANIIFKDAAGPYPVLAGMINLNNTKFPGMRLTFDDATKAGTDFSKPAYDQTETSTLETVLGTFTKL